MVGRRRGSEMALAVAGVLAAGADRDRYVDLLRLFSIVMVAIGHWVLALLGLYGSGGITTTTPAMLATWLWQVMPLFFFVGGFAHACALRHRPSLATFLRGRLDRLLRPALVFVGVWTGLALILGFAGAATGQVGFGLRKVTSVLWFLGVYLLVVLLAPAMMWLHRRYGLWVVPALGLVAAVVDVIALGRQRPEAGVLNVLFVWLAVHQLGYGYADGSLLRGGRRLAALLAAGGLAATVLLVFGVGAYPVLMVGLPDNAQSNMAPPTLALLTQSVFLIGLALLLRPTGLEWLRRPRVWRVVAMGNTMVMTIFCWHLSAVAVVQLALLALGVQLPCADSPWWLAVLPAWLAACALSCAVTVRVFRSFEWFRSPTVGAAAPAIAGGLTAASGLFILSQVGLDNLTSLRARVIDGIPVTAGLALALLTAGAVLLFAWRKSSV
ncbi:MAG: acyltransferase [Pseudonocardia sp.]|nr:acyltransferase [Pseudonocardia sp.]